jgi:hypothetical protein
MNHWMFKCKEVTRMISESMDKTLPLHHRIMIRMHLVMCKYCSRFKRQLLIIRAACRHLTQPLEKIDPAVTLPMDARRRINAALIESD